MEIPKSNGEGSPKQEGKPHLNNEVSRAYLALVKSREQATVAKEPSDVEYSTYIARRKEVDFFAKAGATPYIMNTFSYTTKLYDGDWKNSINNPAFVKAVGDDTKMQDTLRSTGELVVPESEKNTEAGEAVFASMADQLSRYGKNDDEVDMSYVEMASGVPYGSMSEKKGEWLASRVDEIKKTIIKPEKITQVVSPTEKNVAYDGDKMVEDAKKAVAAQIEETDRRVKTEQEAARKLKEFKEIAEKYTENDDILRPVNGEVEPIKELISDLSKQETATQVVGKTETAEKKKRMTEEEYNAQVEIWKKNLEGARIAVENAEKALQESREKSKKNLESMGLNRIEKGLAAWKKVHPGYKMALGLTLGASGLGAVAVGLSAVTFTEKVYREKQAALVAAGKTENKYWTIGKSAGIGVLLALGSSLAGQYVSGALSEGSPSMLDSVREFFSPAAGIPSVEAEVVVGQSISPASSMINGYDLPPAAVESVVPPPVVDASLTESSVALVPETSTPLPAASAVEQVPPTVVSQNYTYANASPSDTSISLDQIVTDFSSPISLNETYVMQAGDTTDSILQRVLNTVPELHALPELDKLSYIENLKEQWSTTMSSASTPNWSLKEMMGGATGSEVHHLDHVRDAFVTLGERSNIITAFKN